jgi:hypothetical protein
MSERPVTDGEMLRTLAAYFDLKDATSSEADDEVQRDLRRIADRLDALDDLPLAEREPVPEAPPEPPDWSDFDVWWQETDVIRQWLTRQSVDTRDLAAALHQAVEFVDDAFEPAPPVDDDNPLAADASEAPR